MWALQPVAAQEENQVDVIIRQSPIYDGGKCRMPLLRKTLFVPNLVHLRQMPLPFVTKVVLIVMMLRCPKPPFFSLLFPGPSGIRLLHR